MPRPSGAVSWLLRLSVALMLTVATACAAPPQKEMDQAQGAIDTARAAGADQYAAAELTAADTALQRSHEAAGQRDYRQALNHALDARERAQTAAREAADKKAIARGEAERALTALELAIAGVEQRLASPPAAGATPRPPAPLTAALTAAKETMQEARSHVQAQRFGEAVALAGPGPQRLRAAIAALEDARRTTPTPRSGRRPR